MIGEEYMIGDMMESCTLLYERSINGGSDGQGGIDYTWEDGASFKAKLIKSGSPEVKIAERQGLKEQYTVVVPAGVTLRHQQVFRRDSDKATFRVTGSTIDNVAPEWSSVQIAKTTAERWEVPK